MQKLKRVYLKDYKAPSFSISSIELKIDIFEEYTLVSSCMSLSKTDLYKEGADLILDGNNLELLDVKINGARLENNRYKQTTQNLIIYTPPDDFHLETQVKIFPHKNLALEGLYKSSNLYCTQCEAEGFRRITYYLDRPDVLTKFTTKIIADKNKYPVLLSNGNLIESGYCNQNRHYAVWEDPFLKPCYLFAMIAGDLLALEDNFITASGKVVKLKLYIERENLNKTQYALPALKDAMRWDEKRYGLEYDLDNYMIVAVNDFNMGAMENKGLNIFNSKYVLASPRTATDNDIFLIYAVIAHEYFHNYSGNRVTCKSWFELSLKEGLTVFREQQFCEDFTNSPATRIEQVKMLQNQQFSEDNSSMSHPVRPESYVQINNFYTATIYEKGAEVIRMLHTMLGEKLWRKGSDLYFSRFDGQAVCIDSFISVMEEVSGQELSQFKLWYSQAGTPEVTVKVNYNEMKKSLNIKLEQKRTNDLSYQSMVIPIKVALFDSENKHKINNVPNLLILEKKDQDFTFENIENFPVISVLRDFSAPIKINYQPSIKELLFLVLHDDNDFVRWQSMQDIFYRYFESMLLDKPESVSIDEITKVWEEIIASDQLSCETKVQLLTLPSKNTLIENFAPINPIYLNKVFKELFVNISSKLFNIWKKVWKSNHTEKHYTYNVKDAGHRSFKNLALVYLAAASEENSVYFEEVNERLLNQFEKADNMTDIYAVLVAVNNLNAPLRNKLFDKFYSNYSNESLVVNKWLQLSALSEVDDNLQNVEALTIHPGFDSNNPNKIYALLGGFCRNIKYFHAEDGSGYKFIADWIIKVQEYNPQVAARLTKSFTSYKNFTSVYKDLILNQVVRINQVQNLAVDVAEIVNSILNDNDR